MNTIDIFDGDPALQITPDGADLIFVDGQPIMDRGLENQAIISLFTEPGWIGNSLVQTPQGKIGSNFVKKARGPITMKTLNDVRQAAMQALDLPVFGEILAQISNPTAQILKANITIKHPRGMLRDLLLTRSNGNWIYQRTQPANRSLERVR